jgi:hypothetical protein
LSPSSPKFFSLPDNGASFPTKINDKCYLSSGSQGCIASLTQSQLFPSKPPIQTFLSHKLLCSAPAARGTPSAAAAAWPPRRPRPSRRRPLRCRCRAASPATEAGGPPAGSDGERQGGGRVGGTPPITARSSNPGGIELQETHSARRVLGACVHKGGRGIWGGTSIPLQWLQTSNLGTSSPLLILLTLGTSSPSLATAALGELPMALRGSSPLLAAALGSPS